MKISNLSCIVSSGLFLLAVLSPSPQVLVHAQYQVQYEQLANDPPSYFGAINNAQYLTWLEDNQIESKYKNSVYIRSIDEAKGAAVHWSVVDDEYIHVAVAARASGWVGFGLTDVGGMLGSDMALFSISNPNKIVDAHVVENPLPKEDDCQRDWIFVNASTPSAAVATATSRADEYSEEFIMFEARRKLVTGDPQDIPLMDDSNVVLPRQRIIAAWGDTPEVSFHGTNNARGSIRVFGQQAKGLEFEDNMNQNADGSFVVGAENYVIPANDTTYKSFCFTRKDLIEAGAPNTTDPMSFIGFLPVIADGPSAPFVHHYIVTAFRNASDQACDNGPPSFEIVFAWAPGDAGFAMPDLVGGNLFGDDGYNGFNIEIHYDNPRLQRDVIDSSGVKIFYTTTPRPIEMGILSVGDPMVSLYGEAVGSGLSGHHFDCPSSCSSFFLDQASESAEPVTVFREYLHMHIAGTRSTNEHLRNGTVIRTASTEVWDFDQNGNVPVMQEPYEIYPGDNFRLSCYYRGNEESVFGLSSRDEMCIAFLYYYPAKKFSFETPEGTGTLPWMCGRQFDWIDGACNATYTSDGILPSEMDMNRLFGSQKSECLVATDAGPQIDVAVEEAEEPATLPQESAADPEGLTEQEPVPENAGGALVGESSPVSGATSSLFGGYLAGCIAMLVAFVSF